jgi:lipopolysaccharide exporter
VRILDGGIRRGAFHVSVGSAASRGVSLVSTLLVARLLLPSQFGVVGFAQTTATLISGIGALALPAIVTREVAQRRDGKSVAEQAASVAVMTTLVVVTVALAVIAVFHRSLLPQSLVPGEMPLLLAGVALSAVAQAFNGVLLAFLQGTRSFRGWSRVTLMRAFLVGGATAVFAISGSAGWVVVSTALAEATVSVVLVRRLRLSPMRHRDRATRSALRRLLRLSVAPALAGQSIQGALWFGQFLLAKQPNGLAMVGWFVLASRLAVGISFLPGAVISAAAPYIHSAAEDLQLLRSTARKTFRDVAVVSVGSGLLLVISAPILVVLGEGYSGAVPVVRILALSVPLSAMNSLSGIVAIALRRLAAWAASDVVLAVTYAGLAAVFVPAAGAQALAVVVNFAYATSIAALVLLLLRPSRRPPRPKGIEFAPQDIRGS